MNSLPQYIIAEIVQHLIKTEDIINFSHVDQRFHRVILSNNRCREFICSSLKIDIDLQKTNLDETQYSFINFANLYFMNPFSKFLTTKKQEERTTLMFVDIQCDEIVIFQARDITNVNSFVFHICGKFLIDFLENDVLKPRNINFPELFSEIGFRQIDATYLSSMMKSNFGTKYARHSPNIRIYEDDFKEFCLRFLNRQRKGHSSLLMKSYLGQLKK